MADHALANVQFTEFPELLGKTLVSVEQYTAGDGNDGIRFILEGGSIYGLTHFQDCCESVGIDSIDGDLQSLVGSPLTMAEEAYADATDYDGWYDESATWSFYRFATVNGYVTIRFYGSSNGYYGETACLYCAHKE